MNLLGVIFKRFTNDIFFSRVIEKNIYFYEVLSKPLAFARIENGGLPSKINKNATS